MTVEKAFPKMAEGASSFQQYPESNKVKLTEDDEPIEVKKEAISSMAPKEKINDKPDYILGDEQTDTRFKKSLTPSKQYIDDAEQALKELHLSESFDINELAFGIKIEYEHGTGAKSDIAAPDTNITNDNLLKTAKIAIAHLREIPDYYTRLDKMEKEAKAEMIKKSGSFSPKEQTESEVSNQQTPPIKVDAVAETQKKNEVTENKAPFFKGFNPNEEDESFYKSIDEVIEKVTDLQKSHLISPNRNMPRGSKDLAEKLELKMYSSFRKAINNWFINIDKTMDPDDMLVSLKKDLISTERNISSEALDGMYNLLSKGVQAGIKKTNVPVDINLYDQITSISLKNHGIGPSIHRLSDDIFKKTSTIIRNHYTEDGLPEYRTKRDIDSNLHKMRTKTRLMLKTETAKWGNLGMLEAFNQDPDKYFYSYQWNSVNDQSTKNISKMRAENSPYTFDEIFFLWKNQEQVMFDGHIENDSFNQRCFISRGDKLENIWKGNRFFGREEQFRETL